MDIKSERKILDGLRELCSAKCITVMTTHRLVITLEPWVDRILILENGVLLEQGNAPQLYSQNGEYRKLLDLSGLKSLLEEKYLI